MNAKLDSGSNIKLFVSDQVTRQIADEIVGYYLFARAKIEKLCPAKLTKQLSLCNFDNYY